jgi:hypothetical protein
MNSPKAIMAVEVAILAMVLAITIPRVIARTQASIQTPAQVENGAAALEFARQRFWDEFVDSRARRFPGHVLPQPSLQEYMHYLNALGLYTRGDQVVVPILPPIQAHMQLDRLRIELQHTTLPIRLKVSFEEARRGYAPVGQLEIFVESNGAWGMAVSKEVPPKSLFSYLPITPKPILP